MAKRSASDCMKCSISHEPGHVHVLATANEQQKKSGII